MKTTYSVVPLLAQDTNVRFPVTEDTFSAFVDFKVEEVNANKTNEDLEYYLETGKLYRENNEAQDTEAVTPVAQSNPTYVATPTYVAPTPQQPASMPSIPSMPKVAPAPSVAPSVTPTPTAPTQTAGPRMFKRY